MVSLVPMNDSVHPTIIKVALPVFPGVSAGTVMGLLDTLSSAGYSWQCLMSEEGTSRRFEPVLVGHAKGLVPCANGARLGVEKTFQDDDAYDLVVVGSIQLPVADLSSAISSEFTDWLKRTRERGATLASVCSGSLALAKAGLLEGLEATTHWAYAGYFNEIYPSVQLKAEEYLVKCDVDPPIITAGGGSSWHDLALHLVNEFIDADTAAQVARVFLMHWHEDQQTVFACLSPSLCSTDATIAKAQKVMRKHFAEVDVLEKAAASSALPKRTYQRRFRQATGMTPTQQLQLIRIENAKQAFRVSTESVEKIGWDVGYEDSASFRRMFKKLNGISPGEYRRRFLPKHFSSE